VWWTTRSTAKCCANLVELGVQADFVTNGAEALQAAKARAYDVVFMDGSMPEWTVSSSQADPRA
jgi:CheY-like chemotaxis protein